MDDTKNIDHIITYIDDFDSIIKIDARGKIFKVYKHILLKSTYFKIMLENHDKKEDKIYYVDCDKDVLIEMIAYMETDHMKTNNFRSNYLKFMMEKFGIDCQFKKKESIEDRIKKREMDKKQKEETFKKNLVDFVISHVKNNNLVFSLEFLRRNENEFKIINNNIICFYSFYNREFVTSLLKSESVTKDFFSAIEKEGYIIFSIKCQIERISLFGLGNDKAVADKINFVIKKNNNTVDDAAESDSDNDAINNTVESRSYDDSDDE
jgi:hypothetical protein